MRPKQILFVISVCLPMLAANVRAEAAIRVAVLESSPDQTSNIVALLLPKLTAGDRFNVVERSQIDKLLHEQQLSTLLGANAMSGRISVGHILQADLLVFVQPEPGQKRRLNISISETHHGLRLVREPVDPTSAEKAAAAVYQLVDDAFKKQVEKIEEIVAVPPFVNDSLGFEFDYLKGAFARLIESVVAEHKGALVTDIDEGRSIAREINLSNGSDIRRPLPLYILGNFRIDGVGAERRVQITLKLMRGETQVSTVTKANLLPTQVAGALRDTTNSFLAKSVTTTPAVADPKTEAAQLARRARSMMELGSWPESLSLIEASLLLDPDQSSLEHDAIAVLTEFAGDRILQPGSAIPGPADSHTRLAYYLLGLHHVERYFRMTEIKKSNNDDRVIARFAYCLNQMGTRLYKNSQGVVVHQPDWPLFVESRDAARDMIYRVMADKARRKVVDDTMTYLTYFDDSMVDDDEWGIRNVDHEPRALARRDRRLKLLADFTYMPNEGDLLWHMLSDTFPNHYNADFSSGEQGYEVSLRPEYIAFLKEARELPNENLRKVANERLQNSAITRVRAENGVFNQPFHPKQLNRPNSDAEVSFTKVALHIDGGGKIPNFAAQVESFEPVGKGIDFVTCRAGSFLMRNKGVLEPIRNTLSRRLGVGQFECFDGKYVWTHNSAIMGKEKTHHSILVIDPNDGKVVAEIDAKKILPDYRDIQFAPLGPGKVAVVAWFGQTFLATIEYRPGIEPKATILHEFRKVAQHGDPQQWRDAEVEFQPRGLYVLHQALAGGGSKQSLLAWRRDDALACFNHPIIVDLPSGEPRAVETDLVFDFMTRKLAASDGVVYKIDYSGGNTFLDRIAVSGVTRRPAGAKFGSVTILFEHDGVLHCIDDGGRAGRPEGYPVADGTWSVAAKDFGPFRTLKMNLPADSFCLALFRTEHYGLLASIVQKSEDIHAQTSDLTIYQVNFSKPLAEVISSPSPK